MPGKLSLAAATMAALIVATTAAPAQTPKRGGILNFAVVAETSGYDCHASQTFALLHPVTPQYSLLVRWDATENSKIVGDLAKSWTIAPDGLTYTFTLHDGIKFHDGSPLTSADIKATFERIANPPEGVISVRKERFADVDAIETPDPATVVFKLKQVNASFLALLASPFNCVYSAAKLKVEPQIPRNRDHGLGRLPARRARARLALDRPSASRATSVRDCPTSTATRPIS